MGRKFTIDEVKQICDQIERDRSIKCLNPEDYQNCYIKLWWKCEVCDHIWETNLTCLKNKHRGCPECGKKAGKHKLTLKSEDIIKYCENQNFKCLNPEEYIGYHTNNLWFECKICGFKWKSCFGNVKRNIFCPECNKKRNIERMKDHPEDVIEFSKDKTYFCLNPEDLINSRNKLRWKCLIDGYEWEASLASMRRKKYGCAKCTRNAKLTPEEIIEYCKDKPFECLNPYDYINSTTSNLWWKCNKDGRKWKTSLGGIRHGSGCPECANVYTHGLLSFDPLHIDNFCKDKDFYCINSQEYININTPLKWQCKNFDHIWEAPFAYIKSGSGCPICKSSKGELRIRKYLKDNNIHYIAQKSFKECKNKNKLKFDFYLSDYNLCIEYDGEGHYYPVRIFGGIKKFVKRLKRDLIKELYCIQKDIDLLRIPYWDFDNIEEILKECLTKKEKYAIFRYRNKKERN